MRRPTKGAAFTSVGENTIGRIFLRRREKESLDAYSPAGEWIKKEKKTKGRPLETSYESKVRLFHWTVTLG